MVSAEHDPARGQIPEETKGPESGGPVEKSDRGRLPWTHVRDWSIASIPLVLFLGYLTWSAYAIKEGLGLLPLSTVQVASAGILVAILLIGLAGGEWAVVQFVIYPKLEGLESTRWRRANLAFQRLLGKILVSLSVILLVWLLGSPLQMFRPSAYFVLVGAFVLTGLLLGVLELLVPAMERFAGWLGRRNSAILEFPGLFAYPRNDSCLWSASSSTPNTSSKVG